MTMKPTFARARLRQLPHWLALAAVLLQIIASFGHIHAEDYRFLVHGQGATIVKAGNTAPSGPGPMLAADIGCAICASVQILGSGALPDAAPFPNPSLESVAPLAAITALFLTPPRHFLFSTRAPPLV